MKVLVDTNILRNAVTHLSIEISRTIRWGDHDCPIRVLERQAQLPREDETFRSEQLPYLATISELAKLGKLLLFSSHELRMERVRQNQRNPGYVGLNLFENVPLEVVQTPIERQVMFFAFDRNVGVTENEQMEFFRSISYERFLAIRRAVGDGQIDDGFHLWTAEVANLDVFLTMDRKFIEVMHRAGQRAMSPVSVWSPKDLCISLGEEPMDLAMLAKKYPPFS